MPNHYPNASFVKRALSTLYDSLILGALSLLYFALVTAFFQLVLHIEATEFKPNARGFAVQIGWLLTLIGFYCFFWLRVGQTVAMKAWRLKVVRLDGGKITFSQSLLRCLLGFFAFALAGLGYLWIVIDKDNLALHDKLSKTKIIQLPKGN